MKERVREWDRYRKTAGGRDTGRETGMGREREGAKGRQRQRQRAGPGDRETGCTDSEHEAPSPPLSHRPHLDHFSFEAARTTEAGSEPAIAPRGAPTGASLAPGQPGHGGLLRAARPRRHRPHHPPVPIRAPKSGHMRVMPSESRESEGARAKLCGVWGWRRGWVVMDGRGGNGGIAGAGSTGKSM